MSLIVDGEKNFRGPKIPKSGSRDPHMTSFDLILHFLVSTHCHSSLCQIMKFLASTVPEIIVCARFYLYRPNSFWGQTPENWLFPLP